MWLRRRLGRQRRRRSRHPRRLIAEQLLTDRYLRDAVVLSRAYGADRVRLFDESDSYPAVSAGPRYVRFEGETYRFDGELDNPPY